MATARRSRKARGFWVQKPQGTFTPRVQAVGPEHFGIVSSDCAKARSKFGLGDFYSRVLIAPTVLEHTQAAFAAARDQVRAAQCAHALRDRVGAVESTGTYQRPVQHALRQAGFETRLVHPFASKPFRQPAAPGNKTDDTDLAALVRAAANGFGLLPPTGPRHSLERQQLVRPRRDLVHQTTTLRCPSKETLPPLMPGYTARFAAHFFETPVALPLARATGSAQVVLDAGRDGLRRALPHHLRYARTTLTKVLTWARTATPPPQPWPLDREHRDRRADAFLQKPRESRGLAPRSARLLAQTPFRRLRAAPGSWVVSAAALAGAQGPPEHYAHANHLTGRAGLCPSRSQSDQGDGAHGPLRRHGQRRRRAALWRLADNLLRHHQHFQAQAARCTRHGKDPRWIHVQVATSFRRLLVVLLTGDRVVPHPACQPRHSLCDQLMGFPSDQHTELAQAREDIDHATRPLSGRTCREEAELLRQQLDQPRSRHGCGRRRGPVPLAQLIPLVLARLGVQLLQAKPEGEDPS